MKEILSNIQCHTFFLIRKWSIASTLAAAFQLHPLMIMHIHYKVWYVLWISLLFEHCVNEYACHVCAVVSVNLKFTTNSLHLLMKFHSLVYIKFKRK